MQNAGLRKSSAERSASADPRSFGHADCDGSRSAATIAIIELKAHRPLIRFHTGMALHPQLHSLSRTAIQYSYAKKSNASIGGPAFHCGPAASRHWQG